MKQYIEAYKHPALLIDAHGKVLARNTAADFRAAPIRIGASIKPIMSVQDLESLRSMSYGEIKSVQIRTERVAGAMAVRFRGFWYLGWMPSRAKLARAVLDVNSAVGNGSLGVLNYCMSLDERSAGDMGLFKQVVSEQLRREMNVDRMLEIVSNSDLKRFKSFNPYLAAGTVCGIADGLMRHGKQTLICRLDATDVGCTGIEEDYCSALSAMIAFAMKNCAGGRIWVEGVTADRRYRVKVSFKSTVSIGDIDAALYGVDEDSTASTAVYNADLLYIRCIAENGLWGFSAEEDAGGEITLDFSVPLYAAEAMSLMQPGHCETLSALIKAQLLPVLQGLKS